MDKTYPPPQRKERMSPALALAVLSPVVAEILGGSTHLSILFALVPEIMIWGCGAVLIREIVRRRRLSGTAMLLLGFVLSLCEEIFIQQTSLAPLPWLKTAAYGRAFGVNWIFLLFMLVYESVWVVLVPVQLVELIYPRRRSQPWLRMWGLIVTCFLFVLGSCIAWYAWIQRARPMVFHAPPYHPSPFAFVAGFVVIVALVAAALSLRAPQEPAVRAVPSATAMFFIVLAMGLPWWMLLVIEFSNRPALLMVPFIVPMTGGIAWATLALMMIRRWSSAASWSALHRYACVFAALVVCMIGGALGARSWLRVDQIAQGVFDAVAVGWMIAFGWSLTARAPEATGD